MGTLQRGGNNFGRCKHESKSKTRLVVIGKAENQDVLKQLAVQYEGDPLGSEALIILIYTRIITILTKEGLAADQYCPILAKPFIVKIY